MGILFQLAGASPQETWEKNLRFLSLQVKSQVSHQHENSYVSRAGLAGELGLTTQLPGVFRLSDREGAVLFRSKRSQLLLPVLPSPKHKVSGALAVETGVQEGLNPVSKGDCGGGGGTLDTPTAGSAPGLLVLFSLNKVRVRGPGVGLPSSPLTQTLGQM